MDPENELTLEKGYEARPLFFASHPRGGEHTIDVIVKSFIVQYTDSVGAIMM